jgi:hypothetical protein
LTKKLVNDLTELFFSVIITNLKLADYLPYIVVGRLSNETIHHFGPVRALPTVTGKRTEFLNALMAQVWKDGDTPMFSGRHLDKKIRG